MNSSISNYSVSYKNSFCLHTVKCQKQFNLVYKNSSISNNSVLQKYAV